MTEYRDGVTEHCDEATDWRKGKAEGRKYGISGEESQTELKNNLWAIIVKNCSMRRSDRAMWRKDGGNDREMVGMTERWWEWRRDGGYDEDAESDDEGLEGLKNEDGMTIKRRNEGIDDRDDE